MSFNQFRSDKVSDSQYRKSGNRSGNTASSYQRTNSGKSSGGGGPAPPGSLQSSRSFKKTNNVQGGPSRVGAPSVSPELNNAPAPTRNAQNGLHQQAPSREMADGPARTAAARITELPSTHSSKPADPKILLLQSASGCSNPKLMQTPPKTEGGPPRGFSLQFGSISPEFVNGMQIPPRTTLAPPNLDEQKRDQSRVEFSRPAPAVPIPSVPKQQLAVKESSVAKQKHPLVAVSHPLPDMKKKTHAPSQAPLSLPQKPSAVHVSGMPMPVPFHQPHGPIQFGVTPQLQPQVVPSTSLQMPPILSVGSSPLLQQPMFIPAIQPLPMQHRGIMHQGQGMNFTNQLRPQLSHQIRSRGINIGPQFTPPQAGKFDSPRRAVKITHPDTREELRLDRRKDGIAGGPPKSGIHTGVLPQPQPVPFLRSAHPNNYYSSSFSSPYYPPASVVPSIQITPNPKTAKANHSNNQSHQNPILGNATAEGKRPESATAKGKRQKKELLQKADAAGFKNKRKKKKADAAGSTSDLYTAYKGPENKELTLSTESSESGSGCIDLKKLPADTKEGIKAGKSEPENWEDAEYLQSKVSKQTSIDMKEETKDGIMGTNNSSITIEVEQLERESKKSLTPSVGIEFSKTVEVDLVPSAVFTGNHDTTSDESDLSNTVLELKDTASLSVAGSNDRAPLDMSRPKSATAKGKRQKKELLQKADAARSTSDLYTEYKGPENKELTLSTESSEGGSDCIDLKKLPADTKEGIKAGKSEAQVKSEPENWEGAENIRGEGSETAMAKASASASSFTSLFARGGEVAMGVLYKKVERDLIKLGDHIYSWRSAYIYAHHGIYVGDGKVIHFTSGAGQEIGTGTALDKFIFSSSPSHNPNNPCPNCGDQSRLDGVICSCLDCFLAGGDLYLFEYDVKVAYFLAKSRGGTCTLAKSDPPGAALHRASFLLENGFGVYHTFKNNCEDFAIYCKTGLLVSENIFSVGRSGQAASLLALATTVNVMSSRLRFLTTNLGGLAVVGNFGGLAVVGAGMYCVSRLASDMGVRRDVVRVPVETLVECFGTRRR